MPQPPSSPPSPPSGNPQIAIDKMLTQIHIVALTPPRGERGLWRLEFQEADSEREFVLLMSEADANIIAKATTKNNTFPDIITFVEELTSDFRIALNQVVINERYNGNYQASMEFTHEEMTYIYDLQAVDAIAFAIAQEARIMIDEKFLKTTVKLDNLERMPINQVPTSNLKEMLNQAIQMENYELAGTIRDEIKRREQ